MAVDGVEAVRGGGADDFNPADGAARDVDHVAGGQDGGLAVQGDLEDAGDDGIDRLAK